MEKRESHKIANKKWYDKWYKTKGIEYHKEYQSRGSTKARIAEYRDGDFYKVGTMLSNAKKRAETLNIPFNLTRDDIHLPKNCPVLGVPLRWGREYGMPDSYSLDRINPSRGYVKGNIKIISFRANYIKNNGTSAEHRAVAEYMEGLEKEI